MMNHLPNPFHLDNYDHNDAGLESAITAAHELTHCFYNQGYNCNFDLDNRVDCPHGLMNYNDPRSYLHVNHILLLRAGLPVYDEADF